MSSTSIETSCRTNLMAVSLRSFVLVLPAKQSKNPSKSSAQAASAALFRQAFRSACAPLSGAMRSRPEVDIPLRTSFVAVALLLLPKLPLHAADAIVERPQRCDGGMALDNQPPMRFRIDAHRHPATSAGVVPDGVGCCSGPPTCHRSRTGNSVIRNFAAAYGISVRSTSGSSEWTGL